MKKSNKFRKVFAERLKEARTRRGLDQSLLAERIGLKPSAISHFENGRRVPSVETLLNLADELNVSASVLLGRDKEVQAQGPALRELLCTAADLRERDLATTLALARELSKRK